MSEPTRNVGCGSSGVGNFVEDMASQRCSRMSVGEPAFELPQPRLATRMSKAPTLRTIITTTITIRRRLING